MEMVTVKTEDLIGPALDWAVAQVDDVKTMMMAPRKGEPKKPFALFGSLALTVGGEEESSYTPSTCWHCGGPLIEKYEMTVILMQSPYEKSEQAKRPGTGIWSSKQRDMDVDYGWLSPTPLIAVCRAAVRYKLGDEVQVPAELVQP